MNTLIKTLIKTDANVGSLIFRVPVGTIFAAHGAQKLFGWFGGYGLEGTAQWLASVGIEPGYLMAVLSGSAEFFGGVALAIQGGGALSVDRIISKKVRLDRNWEG